MNVVKRWSLPFTLSNIKGKLSLLTLEPIIEIIFRLTRCKVLLHLNITFTFRTYSVDSSESSSDEGNEDKDVREEVEELTKVLSDLMRENRELEVS